jgi:hypothetical protein
MEWSRLSDWTVDDLLKRASEYRRMAATARTVESQQSLLRLAQAFDHG